MVGGVLDLVQLLLDLGGPDGRRLLLEPRRKVRKAGGGLADPRAPSTRPREVRGDQTGAQREKREALVEGSAGERVELGQQIG